MNTQEQATYNAAQKRLADVYRVHKVNSSFMKGLHSGVCQLAVMRLAQGGRVAPEFWQELCTGIDKQTKSSLAEMKVNIGPVEVSVHDVLAMVSQAKLDLTPRNSIYKDMNLAVARALLGNDELRENDVDQIDTAVTVYHQIAIQFFNLACEWYLMNQESGASRQMFSSLVSNAIDVLVRSSIIHYVPETNTANIEDIVNGALQAWAVRHYEKAAEKPGPVNSYVPFVATMVALCFSDIEDADEILLASNAAIYNPEYKALQDVDRAYIVFHQAMAKVNE